MSDLPFVLLPYQSRWLNDPSPVKIAEKTRRCGLSWATAAGCVLDAARAQGGEDTWYLSATEDMAREFARDAADWARHFEAACSEIRECFLDDQCDDVVVPDENSIKAARITFASGHRITALPARARGIRGKAGHCVLDEAAFADDLPALLQAALALLIWQGRVSIISTHFGEDNPFNQLIQETRAGKWPYSLHYIPFDLVVQEGLYQRICLVTEKVWTPEAEAKWVQEIRDFYGEGASEELDCIPSSGGGSWLPRPVIEQCMVPGRPVLRLRLPTEFATWPEAQREAEMLAWCAEHLTPLLLGLPRHLRHFVGTDFGRTGDLSVFAPLTETQDLRYEVPFLVELRNVPFEQQKQLAFALGDQLPRFSGAAFDAGGNGAYLAEVAAQRYGPKIAQVKLSEQFYRDHMPPFKAALEDLTYTFPKDADVLQDLRAIAMTRGIAKVPETKRTKGSDGGERHGDAAMALVLGHYAARAGLGEAAGAMTQTDTQTYHSSRQARRRVW